MSKSGLPRAGWKLLEGASNLQEWKAPAERKAPSRVAPASVSDPLLAVDGDGLPAWAGSQTLRPGSAPSGDEIIQVQHQAVEEPGGRSLPELDVA